MGSFDALKMPLSKKSPENCRIGCLLLRLSNMERMVCPKLHYVKQPYPVINFCASFQFQAAFFGLSTFTQQLQGVMKLFLKNE